MLLIWHCVKGLWQVHEHGTNKRHFLIVCYYHVTFAFKSESTLYICPNVKQLLPRNRRHMWSLSDCNGTRTLKHLSCKRTLNHFVYELSGCGFESRCSHLKSITSQTKLHVYYCKHDFRLHTRESFVCIFRWFRKYFYFIRRTKQPPEVFYKETCS